MFHKVIGIIRDSNQAKGFQAYYNNVQRSNSNGGPTYDEARRDYKEYENIKIHTFGNLV